MTAPAYTTTCAAATNWACSSRNSAASESRWKTSARTLKKGFWRPTTPTAPAIAPMAAMKKRTSVMRRRNLLALGAQRRALERLGEQHLLREDQVGPGVVRHLVVVAHRDRVERAGDLAVPAEDAAREVDLVDGRVALTGAHAVLGRVLGGDDADAVRRARGRAQRAADALLEAGVGEAVEAVAAAEARVDGRLLLGVLERRRPLGDARERGLQAAQRLAEGAVDAAGAAGLRGALDGDDVVAGAPGDGIDGSGVGRPGGEGPPGPVCSGSPAAGAPSS